MDLISIIIPVYNAEAYLDRCIGSICNQTYKNIEIILIDDGSQDQSLEICKSWQLKDRRVITIHQENQGVSVARNKGIRTAEGRYILQIDSDDYICTTMVEKMLALLKQDNSDLVICDFEKGMEENYQFDSENKEDNELLNSYDVMVRMYGDDHNKLRYVVPWAKLYKNELFTDLNYPEGKIFEDIYLTHHIVEKCHKISILNEKLTYYYQAPNSIMNRSFHVGKLDYLEALEDRIQFFNGKGYEDLAKIAYEEYLHSLVWEYSRVRDILHTKELMRKIYKIFKKYYQKGYKSTRYSNETALFLRVFSINPELIMIYWRVSAKLKGIFK